MRKVKLGVQRDFNHTIVMSQAGESGLVAALTIGEYTYIMNGLLVLLQILILRKKFELVQSLQLVIGFVFGYFLDLNM